MYKDDSFLSELIRVFLSFNDDRYSRRTIKNYLLHLREFNRWLPDRRIKDVHQDDVDLFLRRLKSKGYKNSTLNVCIAALKSFFAFCDEVGIKKNLSFTKYYPKEEPQGHFISSGDFDAMIEAVLYRARVSEVPSAPKIALRNLVIFQLLIETGITVTELCGISIEDFDWNKGFLVVKERSRPDRVLRLKSGTVLLIKSYAKVLPGGSCFLTRWDKASHLSAGKISSRTIQRTTLQYSDGKFTPKDFRFTYILNQLKSSRGIYTLSDIVGGLSDDTKTFLRKKLLELKRPIILKKKDYDTFEYLRHKYGKNNLMDLVRKDKIDTILANELKSKY